MSNLRRVSLSFALMVLMLATSFAVLASTSASAQAPTSEGASDASTEGVASAFGNVNVGEVLDASLAQKIKLSEGPFKVYVAVKDRAAVNAVLEANGLRPIAGAEIPGLPTMRTMNLTSAQILALAASPGTMKIMEFEQPSVEQGSALRSVDEAPPGADPPAVEDIIVDDLHGAINAWGNGFIGDGVQIAVIDTGFDMAHPDLLDQQARYTSGPYAGWPIAYDDMAALYWANYEIGGWVADTSYETMDLGGYVEFYGWPYMIDSLQDVDGNPVVSQSGVYHIGLHTDINLAMLWGEWPAVLVVDANVPGWYDTVYVDIDDDYSFNDEKACTMGDETSYFDFYDADLGTEDWDSWDGGDGYPDLSGGMVYWISDGANVLPASDWTYGADFVPDSGDAVAFVGEFSYGQSHGTMTSSAALAVPNSMGGLLAGMAPGADLICIPFTNDIVNAWLFAVWGADGSPGTGDEANIVSNSYGWSDTAIDAGYELLDMYMGFISMYLSDSTTLWCWSTGNGGPGYGTVHSITDFNSIHVGAGTTMQYRAVLGIESDISYSRWGDVAPFSNSGPTRQGKLNAEIVASGMYSMEPAPLNGWDYSGSIGDGSVHFQLGSGTSHATPTVAGGAALGYQAYYQSSGGWWPETQDAKARLMAAADDMHFDPFKQGAGWLNADTLTQMMSFSANAATVAYSGFNEVAMTKAALYPGYVYGDRYEMFPNFLMQGESDGSHILMTENYDPANPVNVHASSELLLRTSSNRIDVVTPDANSVYIDITGMVSPTTDLLKATMFMPYSEFDPNSDYVTEVGYMLELFDWVDFNLDGMGWESSSSGEMFRYSVDGSDSNYNQIMIKDPILRTDSGLIARLRPVAGAAGTNISLQLDCYELQTFPWIQFRLLGDIVWTPTLDFAVGPWSSQPFEVLVTVPLDAPIGTYGAAVYVDYGYRVQNVPVVINVPATDYEFTFGGPSYFDTPYNNDFTGIADKGWRFEVGDWRMYWAMPWSPPPSPTANLIVKVDWTELPTDVNVHVLGPAYDDGWPQWEWPYGPGIIEQPVVGSDERYMGAGTFGIYTNTGGPSEVLGAQLGEWYWNYGWGGAPFAILTRCPIMSGNSSQDTLWGSTSWMFMNDYLQNVNAYVPLNSPVTSTSGTQWAYYDAWLPGVVEVRGGGIGPFERNYYPSEPIFQDALSGNFVQDLANAWYTRPVQIEGTTLSVEVNEVWGAPDIDLGVWYDMNDNGMADGGEPYWYVGVTGSYERLDLVDITPGQYLIKVLGYTVWGSPGAFELTVLSGVPGYIVATDFESPTMTGYHEFSIAYEVPGDKLATYEGYATFGFMGSTDMYSIYVTIQVADGGVPVISNLVPAYDSVLGTSTLEVSFWADDHVNYYSGVDWSSLSIWLDWTIEMTDISIWWVDDENLTLEFPYAVREGYHEIYLQLQDYYGNWAGEYAQFYVDSVIETFTAGLYDPTTFATIRDGSTVSLAQVGVRGVTDPSAEVVVLTATETYITTADGDGLYNFTAVNLTEGANFMSVQTTNLGGVSDTLDKMVIGDTYCSLIVMDVVSPTGNPSVTLRGMVDAGGVVTVEGMPANMAVDGTWWADVLLAEGLNLIYVEAMDAVGNIASQTVGIELDTTAPALTIDGPLDGSTTDQPNAVVYGTTDAGARVMVNGVLAGDGAVSWSATVALVEGLNTITVTAEDSVGNDVSLAITVEYVPPDYVTPEELAAAMAENVSALQVQIDAAVADIASLEVSLAENVTVLWDQIDAAMAEIAATQASLDENVTALQNQIDAANAGIAMLKNALDENVTMLLALIAELDAALADNVTALQDEIAATQASLAQNITALQDQIDVAMAEIAATQASLDASVTALQSQIDAAMAEIAATQASLAQNVAALQDQIDAANAEITMLEDALDENVTTLLGLIDDLDTALGENVTLIQNEIVAIQANIVALQADIAQVEGNVTSLEAQLSADIAALQALTDDMNETIQGQMDDMNDAIQGQLRDVNQQIANLNQTAEDLQSQLDGVNQQIDDLNQTAEDIQGQVDDNSSFSTMLMYLILGLFLLAIVLIVVMWVMMGRKMGGGSSGSPPEAVEEVEQPTEVEKEFEALEKEMKKDEL